MLHDKQTVQKLPPFMQEKPKIKLQLTATDKIWEIIGWLALIALWILTIINYYKLPDTIPIHFNGAGKADGVGEKASILMLPLVATILFVGITLLNKLPHIFNYLTEITADNALRQYTNATRMLRYLKAILVLIFGILAFQTIQSATGGSEGLGFMAIAANLNFKLHTSGVFPCQIFGK